MRLEPVEFCRRDWADVQAVDVRCVGQLALPLAVVRDRGRHECLADFLNHLFLWTLDHRDVREHVFGVGNTRVGRWAMDHPRPKIGAAFFLDQPRTKPRGSSLRRSRATYRFFELV